MIRVMWILLAILAFSPIAAFADIETVGDYHERLVAGYKLVRANSQHDQVQALNDESFELANEILAIDGVLCSADPHSNIDRIYQKRREIVSAANEMDQYAQDELKPAINEIRQGAVLMHFKAKRNYHRCVGLPIQ